MLNKKKIVIIIGAFLVLVGTISAFYFLATSRVSLIIDVKTDDTEYILKNDQDKPIKTFSEDSSFKLTRGNYSVFVVNQKYNQRPIKIELKEDSQITLDPAFSFNYRQKLMEENLAKINSVLTKKYNKNDLFTIYAGEFIQTNNREFYITNLELKTDEFVFTKQAFKVILEKDKDKNWKVIIEPNAILSKFDNSDVPIDVINKANQLTIPIEEESRGLIEKD